MLQKFRGRGGGWAKEGRFRGLCFDREGASAVWSELCEQRPGGGDSHRVFREQ